MLPGAGFDRASISFIEQSTRWWCGVHFDRI